MCSLPLWLNPGLLSFHVSHRVRVEVGQMTACRVPLHIQDEPKPLQVQPLPPPLCSHSTRCPAGSRQVWPQQEQQNGDGFVHPRRMNLAVSAPSLLLLLTTPSCSGRAQGLPEGSVCGDNSSSSSSSLAANPPGAGGQQAAREASHLVPAPCSLRGSRSKRKVQR